jgi:hypothetical protein
MKVRKRVTSRVLAANRMNAKKSTGPHTVTALKHNPLKHGLLAKHLEFQSPEEEAEFSSLHDGLTAEYVPLGRTEEALVEELAVVLWKMKEATAWIQKELRNRHRAAHAIVQVLAEHHDEGQLPLFREGDGGSSDAQLGWHCEGLVIRSGTGNSEEESRYRMADRHDRRAQLSIEATLQSSLDTVLRYQSALKRDFYKALATLRGIQRERHAASVLPANHVTPVRGGTHEEHSSTED